jgi:hypothetical protein
MAKSIVKAQPTLPALDIERYWSLFDRRTETECWIWKGTLSRGYGMFSFKNNEGSWGYVYAHRLAYFLAYGVDPGAFHVCHHCDNPPCVNPRHLWLGTDADNVHDAIAKGRMFQGERNAKLTGSDVVAIRALHATGLLSYPKIGKQFGVSKTMIGFIVHRQNWKHI